MKIPEEILLLAKELRTQDNCCTSHPAFAVQEREDILGVDPDCHAAEAEWIGPEGGRPNELELEGLESLAEKGEIPPGWEKVFKVKKWREVERCFSRKAAEEFIRDNRHNLNEPRIYVESCHRNREWKMIREWIVTLSEFEPRQE